MINLAQLLKNKRKILGRNERQLEYIHNNNLRAAIKLADDKVLSKKILHKNNIPVPKKIAVIRSKRELQHFDFETLPSSFVVKPVKGVRGAGVEIFYNRDKNGNWIRADKSRYSLKDIRGLCQDIIDGKYSLFNEPDTVLIEERIRPHKAFKYFTYKGTPDVRILVYNKIPIMSYIRLPTKASDGKANLDLGGIGAGIDIAVGKTTYSIIGKATPIEYVPGTTIPLSGLKIPYWNKILTYAVEASKVTGLGFAAVDFLIDKEMGPVIVELNARPGLSIQLANQDGLRWRLRKARGLKVKTTEQGVRLGKDLFGGEIEEEIEEISGKQVIGLIENVTLYSINGKNKEIFKAKIDTGADRTSIDEELMKDLGYADPIEYFNSFKYPVLQSVEEAKEITRERDEKIAKGEIQEHPLLTSRSIVKSGTGVTIRPILPLKFSISGIELESDVTVIKRNELSYKVIIGKKDLKQFLIDPSKKLLG
jgi:alpha-L-glutamate ligase-like protein